MELKIWRVFIQILYDRNETAKVLKPFFQQLRNQNIDDDKYISFLKTFSKSQLQVLSQNGIISEEKFNSIKNDVRK